MHCWVRGTNRYRRRAAVVVQVAVASTLVMGMGALAVDIGMLYTAQTELQVSADAAALAAAAQLATAGDVQAAALDAADVYAQKNRVLGQTPGVRAGDVEFGHAVADASGDRFVFEAGGDRYDALRLTLRHTSDDQPDQRAYIGVPLTFAQIFGLSNQNLQARAAAVLVPRDIAVVIDLSASMSDDSELRHYKQYTGEEGDLRPGIQVNLRDIWCALNGPAPSRPYVPAAETATEYAGDTGPTIGVMSTWGDPIVPETYNPVNDPGLWYIKKGTTCTVAAARTSLQARGYSTDEINCLFSSARDSSYGNQWRNRTAVILGLASWKSGRTGGKPGGDGDDRVEDSSPNEITWTAYPSFRGGTWTWANYVDYVGGSSAMTTTNSNLKYRFGLKTFVNFLLENHPQYARTNILWQTPVQPLQAVKDALQSMTDTIVSLESLDHMSLEIFATTAYHQVDLTDVLQNVPDRLYAMQAGHYNNTTCTGGGFQKALDELGSARARAASAKVIVLMSDGKPNVDRYGNSVEEGSPEAVDWVLGLAQNAADLNYRVYTVSVGGDSDQDFMEQLAQIGHGRHFHAEGTPAEYAAELDEIFRTLGGTRPVQLIE